MINAQTSGFPFRNKIVAFVFFQGLITLGILSCVHLNKSIDPKYDFPGNSDSFRETLNKAINKITYDEALMTWGAPVSRFEGDEIFLATWGDEKSGNAIMPVGKSWFGIPIQSGWKLVLSFNKLNRKMVHWLYEKW